MGTVDITSLMIYYENVNNELEEVKNELVDLKIRVKRIEAYLSALPNPHEYIAADNGEDTLYERAVELVSAYDTASAAFIQRKLEIGYSRAARILDQLEENKIVAHPVGRKPGKVLKKE